MNTKLILAIAIVALVGVVAATYQINNTNDLTNSYTDVEPELQVEAGASDSVDSAIGADSANVANPGGKQATTKSSSKTKSKQKNKMSSSGSGSSASTSAGASSGSASSGSNGANQATIDAYSVARSAGIQMGATSTRFISSFTVDGVVYNVYGQYKNGQCIAETEVNTKTGQITGGAWIGEVTHDDSQSSSNSQASSTDSNSGSSSSTDSDSSGTSDNSENTTDTSE